MPSIALMTSLGACLAASTLVPVFAGRRWFTILVALISLAAMLIPTFARAASTSEHRGRRLAQLLVLAWSCANISLAVLADVSTVVAARVRPSPVPGSHRAPAQETAGGKWEVDLRLAPIIAGTVLANRPTGSAAPVAGAIARLYTEDRTITIASAVTGSDGTFVLEIVVPQPGDSYVLTITHPEYRGYAALVHALPGFRYEQEIFLSPKGSRLQ